MNLVPLPENINHDTDAEALWLARLPSQETYRSYATGLRLWHEWSPKPWIDTTLLDLEKYKQYLSQTKAPKTAAQRLAAIKSFLTFAANIRYLPFNVGAALTNNPEASENEPDWEPVDVKAILAAIPEEHWEKRLAFRMLYESACRIGELVAIEYRDLKPALAGMRKAWLRLRKCKGRKERTVCVDEEWLAIFDTLSAMGYPRPFPYTPDWLRKIIRKYGGTNPHNLRHQHAYAAYDAGADMKQLQRQLGHENSRTTELYAHARPKLSTDTYLDLDPLGDLYDPATSKPGIKAVPRSDNGTGERPDRPANRKGGR